MPSYSESSQARDSSAVSVTHSSISSSSNFELNSPLNEFLNESRASVIPKLELDTYLEEVSFPNIENFNILDWWKINSPRLPILAKIARDILAVPATTVASEAAFSVGGRIIDESRAGLHPDAVEASVVANDWIKLTPKLDVRDMESSEAQSQSLV